jgi:hypothetical protein
LKLLLPNWASTFPGRVFFGAAAASWQRATWACPACWALRRAALSRLGISAAPGRVPFRVRSNR